MKDLVYRSVNHQFIKVLYYLNITDIGCLFLKAFLVIGPFHRPGKQTGHFDRTIFTDKYIFRANISYFFVFAMKQVCRWQQGQYQIPEFTLFKILRAHAVSVIDFVVKKKRIVLVGYLSWDNDTSTTPESPQKPSFLNWWDLGSRSD